MNARSGRRVDRPLFFVGMPRSGTTIAFEAFAAHGGVAWFPGQLEWKPNLPFLAVLARLTDATPSMRRSVNRSDQPRHWRDKLRVGPSEAYNVWQRCCGEKFRYEYLLGVQATVDESRCLRETISKVQRYEGKSRFAAKITGPGRIGYLASIFDDARFVHVVRDGRAVVQSLMTVPFWKERERMREPAWRHGLTAGDEADWKSYGRSPIALAAVQWRRVVESARAEASQLAPDRYAEMHYEHFMAEPEIVLDDVTSFCQLPSSPRAKEFLRRRFDLRDMNYQWQERFNSQEMGMLNDLLGSTLAKFGYEIDPRRAQSGSS